MERKPASRLTWTVAWTLVALVLYVLSVGPMYAAVIRGFGGVPESVLQAVHSFYWPLWWASDNWPWAHKILESYLRQFGVAA